MKPFFVIDVGNTSVKWGLSIPGRLLTQRDFPTSDLKKRMLPKSLGSFRKKQVSGAIISCVVPSALPRIRRWLKLWNVRKPLVVSAKMDLGIGIRYPQPDKIGADRLVNAVAAVSLYGAPAVVVDFGTAVTFDVISKKKEYLGGVIAPGLRAMTDYLHRQTALLPSIELVEPPSAIGKSTVAAMRVGAVIGYRGLVLEILTAIARELGARLPVGGRRKGGAPIHVIATGGHSSLIAAKLPVIRRVCPHLTLEGLRLLYVRNTVRSSDL